MTDSLPTDLVAELERERLRLAACGVAAMANTPSTIAQRIGRDNPYWSASYDGVCSAVDREMKYREILDCINMMACYASEENPESRETILLEIGKLARGEKP